MDKNADFGVYDETDKSYVIYRKGSVGYVNRKSSEKLVPKVSEKTLKIMKRLLTKNGVERLCMEKKKYKLVKTITRL